MDYYQGVVADYLDADRAVFLNQEYYLQLDSKPSKGTTWYCDIMAINLRESAIYLCEVTCSVNLDSLLRRLKSWDSSWPRLCEAIRRDSKLPLEWKIQPWVFIPADRKPLFVSKHHSKQMPTPRLTFLESVVPWKYNSDNRTQDALEEIG